MDPKEVSGGRIVAEDPSEDSPGGEDHSQNGTQREPGRAFQNNMQPVAGLKVLVVDDEPGLVELIRKYLHAEGFEVDVAYDGVGALEKVRASSPDLVVLDVMMPEIDGIEVCRRMRHFSDAYVVMLSSRSDEAGKLIGLGVGADDYMTKPFSPRELVARAKAMLRRPRKTRDTAVEPEVQHLLRLDDLTIDLESHEVQKRGASLHLTGREFGLLATLAAHPGKVYARSELLQQLWGTACYADHVVDVHITNLRKKIEDNPVLPTYIETVRGVGYRFSARAARRSKEHTV